MNLIDMAAFALIALGTLHGCLRGLSGELAQVLSVITAFIFGLWCQHPLTTWMLGHTRLTERPAQTLSFVTTLLAALMVLLCVRFLARRIMKVVIEAPFDRVGGALAGFVRSTAIVLILFIVFNVWPHTYLNRKFGEESLIGARILPRLPFWQMTYDDRH